jgi:multicomponent Na+:H+ antiporter subunit A
MLLAHALFKATLFMVVGIVDHQTGSRDLRELSGLRRSAPLLAGTALLAGASMAGLPPLAGFVAKESVFGALGDVAREGDGTGLAGVAGWALLTGVVVGSGLTVAYTARFLWGAFATKPNVQPSAPGRIPAGFLAAPALLAALSLVVGLIGTSETTMLAPYVAMFPAVDGHVDELALWHGPGLAVTLSLVSIGVGLLLFHRRQAFAALQSRLSRRWSAERGYFALVRLLDRAAVEITGVTQRGSVAAYLGVILVVVVALSGGAMVAAAGGPYQLTGSDNLGQVVVAVVIAVAAVLTVRSRRRLKAVILLGVTGYGTAMLFLLHGAPDLALTQMLVETVTLTVFVLVLRRLPEYFTDRPLTRRRYWRMALGALVGSTVAGVMVVSTGARTHPPVSTAFPREAVEFGGGRNIVNVTLVDIRAWDTMGEIAVLVAAATGVASLLFLSARSSAISRTQRPTAVPGTTADASSTRPVWLSAGRTLTPERRSIIFEVVTRLVFHTIVVFSIYLLFAGHNSPGGGFAAGLVTGLALVVRYLAGGRYELDEAAPVDAGALMGTGLFIAAAAGLAPLVLGGAVLQSAVLDLHLPLIGDLHLVTSVFFDVGVYVLVVGLVLDLLRSLGSAIDRHILDERTSGAEVSP